MTTLRCGLVLLVFWAANFGASAPVEAQRVPSSPAKELVRGFQEEVRGKVESPFEAAVAALRGRYVLACEASLKSLSITGKLDEAIAIKRELLNISKGTAVPALENRDRKAEIDRLRSFWHQEAGRLEKERNSHLDTIWVVWESRLSREEESLTRQTRLEDAVIVRDQKSQLKTLTELIKSQHASFAVTRSVFDLVKEVRIKMQVDGQDLVKISAGKLWIEHLSWREPQSITVNGMHWAPEWKGKISNPMSTPDPALAPFGKKVPLLRQEKGRGTVSILQLPTDENSQTLVIRFDDGPNGADFYEAVISW